MRAIPLLAMLAFAGCNSAPATRLIDPGAPATPPDWKKLEGTDGRTSIRVPHGWRLWTVKADQEASRSQFSQQLDEMMPQASPSSEEVAQSMAEEARTNPNASELARAVEQLEEDSKRMQEEMDTQEKQQWAEKGILIRACDSMRPVPGEPRTSLTVYYKAGEGNLTPEKMVEEAKVNLMGESVKSQIVDLPIGKAAQAITSYTNRGGDQLMEVVYLLCDGPDRYTVRFITCNTGLRLDEAAPPMMETLRIRR